MKSVFIHSSNEIWEWLILLSENYSNYIKESKRSELNFSKHIVNIKI